MIGEWKDLFHIDEAQTNLFTNGRSKKDRRMAFLKARRFAERSIGAC